MFFGNHWKDPGKTFFFFFFFFFFLSLYFESVLRFSKVIVIYFIDTAT